jgi:CRP-like cAMP-binding protein
MVNDGKIKQVLGLSSEQWTQIVSHLVRKEYEPDDYIFFEGDSPVQLWFLEKGRVKLLKHSDTGKDVILTVISSGEFLGEFAAYRGMVYPVTAQAIEPATMLLLPQQAYDELLRTYPALSGLIISSLEQRLNEAYDTIRSMAVERVERRIARLLLKLASSVGRPVEGNRILIDMPLTRQDIAEMTGTTVESAIRVMSKLRKQGVINSKNGKVYLSKPHALVSIADEL